MSCSKEMSNVTLIWCKPKVSFISYLLHSMPQVIATSECLQLNSASIDYSLNNGC